MLFKDFASDASSGLAYDWWRQARASDYGAPTLRLLLHSPAYDAANPATAPQFVQLVYEPYWQPSGDLGVNHLPQREEWVPEKITATSGSNRGVEEKFANSDPAGSKTGEAGASAARLPPRAP